MYHEYRPGITGKHQKLINESIEKIERLMTGAAFHKQEIDDTLELYELEHHLDSIERHIKAMRSVITDFNDALK